MPECQPPPTSRLQAALARFEACCSAVKYNNYPEAFRDLFVLLAEYFRRNQAAAAASMQVRTALVGNGALTVIPFNHNLGTTSVVVNPPITVATGVPLIYTTNYTYAITNANTVTYTFVVAPATNAVRVSVSGVPV